MELDHQVDTTEVRAPLSDMLGRRPLAQMLADQLIAEPGVVGVYGSWGSGKSFVLDLTIEELFRRGKAGGPVGAGLRPIVCYFKPWQYEPDTSLAPGLIDAIDRIPGQFRTRNPSFAGPDVQARLRAATTRLIGLIRCLVGILGPVAHVGAAVAGGLPAGAVAPVAGAALAGVAALADATKVQEGGGQPPSWNAAEINSEMSRLVQLLRASAARAEERRPEDYRVVIVIDDLDRCGPDLLVDMLNWLKVHLSVPDCSYLLALDHEAAARAIIGRYSDYLSGVTDIAYGLRYLEKIVSFEVELGESDLVERMAAVQVGSNSSVVEIVERAIRRQAVRSAEIRTLMRLPTLQSPRTMLKVVNRFSKALDELQRDSTERARIGTGARQLPTDYAFWLLLLVAMYYRLRPDQIEDFCHGQGLLIHADGTGEAQSDGSLGPVTEFRDFLAPVLRDSRGRGVLPPPAVLLDLYTAVRQLVVPGR